LQQKINKVIERINNNPNMSQAQKDRLTAILSGTLYTQAQVTAHWENRNQRITVWISNQAEDKQDKLNAWLAKRIANGAPDANIINKKKQRALIKRIAKRIKKKRNPTPDTPPGDG
jgi:ABC-type phosphate transport system substrate-binding protein